MIPSLPLLCYESSVSVKENPDRKEKEKEKKKHGLGLLRGCFQRVPCTSVKKPSQSTFMFSYGGI